MVHLVRVKPDGQIQSPRAGEYSFPFCGDDLLSQVARSRGEGRGEGWRPDPPQCSRLPSEVSTFSLIFLWGNSAGNTWLSSIFITGFSSQLTFGLPRFLFHRREFHFFYAINNLFLSFKMNPTKAILWTCPGLEQMNWKWNVYCNSWSVKGIINWRPGMLWQGNAHISATVSFDGPLWPSTWHRTLTSTWPRLSSGLPR